MTSVEMEDVRLSFFQKSFYESGYPYVSKEDFCFQLIRSLQSSITNGRRRKLGEIGNIEFGSPPKKAFRECVPAKKFQAAEEKKDLINTLPDELLVEVFRYVSSPADRYSCASVSMRWLMLQSHLHSKALKDNKAGTEVETSGDELKRNLEGKRATDVRLALAALGTQGRGGLGKLTIRGGPRQNPGKAVSNVGLSAVGICCENLKVFSIWDCNNVSDAGFSWIGKGCRQLKVLNVLNCPGFGDAGLKAIAAGCPQLTSLSLEGCGRVGDAGLQAVAKHCPELACLSIVNCKNVSDAGIASVVTNCKALKALKLQKLAFADKGLAAVGANCSSLQKLKLMQLDQISNDGFFQFGRDSKMAQLKHLEIGFCGGVTNSFLEVVGKSCQALKLFSLTNCAFLDESSVLNLVNDCASLETLHLEKCSFATSSASASPAGSLKTLNIVNCTGAGSSFFASLAGGSFLKELDLSGYRTLSDEALVFFLLKSGSSLTSLKLSGCTMLTDVAIAAVAKFCFSLASLALEGCVNITDQGVLHIAQGSHALEDLNMSLCGVTDYGMLALLATKASTVKTLSLAGCTRITDRSLQQMEQACENLEALNVKDCKGVSRAKLESFESRLWRCQLCC